MYLQSFACVCTYLYRTGAAVVVSSRYVIPSVFENSYFNPLCFLQYYNSVVPPSEWYQVCVYVCVCVCVCVCV